MSVFIQAVKMPSAALTQLQQLQQQAHFLQRVLLLFVSFCGGSFRHTLTFYTRRLFVSLGIMCLCPGGKYLMRKIRLSGSTHNIGAAYQQL